MDVCHIVRRIEQSRRRQVYWRDKKLATDWASLKAEVHRWQDISGLGWSEDDVAGVARYLNVLHYRYPLPD